MKALLILALLSAFGCEEERATKLRHNAVCQKFCGSQHSVVDYRGTGNGTYHYFCTCQDMTQTEVF